jgi:hypothetical protein
VRDPPAGPPLIKKAVVFIMATTRPSKELCGPEGEFSFVPEELAIKCGNLVNSYHALYGCTRLPDMLWHTDARELIDRHEVLRPILKHASKKRNAKRANNSLHAVAALIVALEVLIRDLAGWGTRFPDAQKKANKLLDVSPFRPRVWLVAIDRGLAPFPD